MSRSPHAYISPSWYQSELAVPTWNYSSVHVYGRPEIIDDHNRVVSILAETIDFYERAFEYPWPGLLSEDFRDRLLGAIVAFEVTVTRIEGKFKLGQNRSDADVAGVYAALSESANPLDKALAEFMASERMIETTRSNQMGDNKAVNRSGETGGI